MKLVACSLRPDTSATLPLPNSKQDFLVLAISHPGYIPVPARSAASTLAALFGGRTGRVVLRGHS